MMSMMSMTRMTRHLFAIGGIVAVCLGTTGGAQSAQQGVLYRSAGGTTPIRRAIRATRVA